MNKKLNLNGVHVIRHGEHNIVVDAESGSLHLFDEASVKALEEIEHAGGLLEVARRSSRIGEEVWDEIAVLIEGGLLYAPNPGMVEQRIPAGIKSLCLNIAHDCNLVCSYCFASQGDFGGGRSVMSPEIGRQAVDFLILNSGERELLELDFFGGEPLMGWETVRSVVAYALEQGPRQGKRFKFSLTTNGVLLTDEVIAFLLEHQVSVVLSLDGRKDINDRMRPFEGGASSYDRIVPRFLTLARATDDYVIRGTYTRHNLDFSRDVEHFLDLGFRHISVEPVVCSETQAYGLRKEDVPRIRQEYERLADVWLEHRRNGDPFDYFHFNVNIDGGPCIYKRVAACGAGFEYLAVTPQGELYPCHQFVGQDDTRMGTVHDGLTEGALTESFRSCHVFSKSECNVCWAKYYCSGGCHANNQEFNGTISRPYDLGCTLHKTRLELALYVQVQSKLEGLTAVRGKNDQFRGADTQIYDKILTIMKK